MKKALLFSISCCLLFFLQAQKIPLDHTVYDGWKSAGERAVSDNGQYVSYVIQPQEGDGILYIKSTNSAYTVAVPRGYQASFTPDSKYLFFKIKPLFKDSREARIKKKKPEEMPKDSLGYVKLGDTAVSKVERVKTFKMPEKGIAPWVAYHLDKVMAAPSGPSSKPDSATQLNRLSRMADSLQHVADSMRALAQEAQQKGIQLLQAAKKDPKSLPKVEEFGEDGTDLVLWNASDARQFRFKYVQEYYFSETGNVLVMELGRKSSDLSKASMLVWYETTTGKADTIFRRFNDAKNYAIDRSGSQLAFVAERDSAVKALTKFYKLYYFKPGMDSARLLVDRSHASLQPTETVSPDYVNLFSKDGQKLFWGIAPVRKPKDTTLVDFETARLDVWHYKDDYLQPQQLLQVPQELKKSALAVLYTKNDRVVRLTGQQDDMVQLGDEGNADQILVVTSRDQRIPGQWQGYVLQRASLVSLADGSVKEVASPRRASYMLSPEGKFVAWYDWKKRQYFSYNIITGATLVLSQKIQVPLWDEEDDHPDDPPPHGIVGWEEGDRSLMIYDRFDIWSLDPTGSKPPINITKGAGRAAKTSLRYTKFDPDERVILKDQILVLRAFNEGNKYAGFYSLQLGSDRAPQFISMQPKSFMSVLKAKDAATYLVQQADINASELYVSSDLKNFSALTQIAQQQESYNWLNVELVKWTMFDGKQSEGLLFKPANFDPTKKYPVIFYFYERNSDGLYNYRAPAPSASTVNIPYFVSNGYLVFDPNIYYKNGEPGQSAYNSVVSAAQYLAKMPWVDAKKMAIQGQSWGGYQVAYLVTRTHMFAAAGAGAPVANMTSAYGGIRWGSGLNRQFQYERTQTRIGATLWDRTDLYLKNSPLFHAKNITTPLLIMHNDKDGAVPWYQGIEFFTALRRLGKTAWLLQYNDEDHNLVERRNRKDLSVRLSQFFDHYLKGAPQPKWMKDGVPAVEKGIEWGL